MGEQYKAILEDKIRNLGGSNLRVYINPGGVHPHYYQHLRETFESAQVKFVADRADANFVFDGNCEPVYHEGQVAAYFQEGRLLFSGAI